MDGRLTGDAGRQMRLAAICSFLYVAVVLGSQIYLAVVEAHLSKGELPSSTATLLRFAYRHPVIGLIESAGAVVAALLLAGPAAGLFLAFRTQRPIAARIILIGGLVSGGLVALGVAIETAGLLSAAGDYAHAASATAAATVVQRFDSRTGVYALIDFLGGAGVAAWLALIGATVLRIRGIGSLPGWASVAASPLAAVGFPVLVAWALGAGIALWRLGRRAVLPLTTPGPAPAAPAPAQPTPRTSPAPRPVRPGKRRRRR